MANKIDHDIGKKSSDTVLFLSLSIIYRCLRRKSNFDLNGEFLFLFILLTFHQPLNREKL